MRSRGFTLIELLVVISIISLLSSMLLATLSQARLKSRDTQRIVALRELQKAIELYRSDHPTYPSTTAFSYGGYYGACLGPSCSTYNDPALDNSLKVYLKTLPTDPKYSPAGYQQGYWYFVNSNYSEFKVAALGTIENMNDVPPSMNDAGVLGSNSASLSSSDSAKNSLGLGLNPA